MECRGEDCLLGATVLIGRTETPRIRGNCYVFGLAPIIGIGGFANRPSKAQPGMKCYTETIDLSKSREKVRNEMVKRVECDNPTLVKYMHPTYTKSSCNIELPRNKHLMACISGKQDYHFLRRMLRKTVLNMKILLNDLNERQLNELKNSNNKHVWVHQRGWSKGPSLVDADGNIAWSPIPKTYNKALFSSKPKTCNFNYQDSFGGINYQDFVGLFEVVSRRATVNSTQNTTPDMLTIKNELRKKNIPFLIR